MGQLLDLCSPIQNVLIRGTITYSRVYKKIEGEELQMQNEKRRARGVNILFNSPYYIVVLENPAIINAAELPPEVVNYFNSKIKGYQNPDGTISNKYYAMSKSKFSPIIAYSKEVADLATGAEIKLRGELDTGLNVTIGANIYKANIGKGVGFDYILLNEPIRYYSGNNAVSAITSALASQGIVYKNETIEPEDDEDTASVPYGESEGTLPFSAPTTAPVQPTTPVAPVQQAPQPPYNAVPAQPVAPVQPTTPVAPVQQAPQPPYNAVPAQPVAPVQPTEPIQQAPVNVQIPPQAPTQPQPPVGGVTYNPLQYGTPQQ